MSPTSTRRTFLERSALTGAGLLLTSGCRVSSLSAFDTVVYSGLIIDGTGSEPLPADLGLLGDAIVAIGKIAPEQGRAAIDASGLHVAPGFIDIHSHSDNTIFRYPEAQSRVMQGITTEVTGNCGDSAAPLFGKSAEGMKTHLADDLGIDADWANVGSYFQALEQLGVAANQALLLGQGSLRQSVVGEDDREATTDEIETLRRTVEEGMEQGAWGLSTGLEYAPGIFTPTAEIVAMAEVAARYGGLYASHIRNEETGLLEAVAEAIDIGRRSGIRVEISHLKAAGRPNWGLQLAAIEQIEQARDEGLDVLADAYPYGAYSTGLTILLPAWARDGGTEALLGRLGDRPTREKIRAALPERMANDPGGPELIQLSAISHEANRKFVGRTLEEVADNWNTDAADAMLRLVEEDGDDVAYIGHAMSAENVESVLSNPLVMIGSDGISMAPEGPAAAWQPHPRSYGTCPRVLGLYSRERALFDLPTAIRKMTSMPADHLGISDRGRIEKGKRADLVIFDAGTVLDEATFEDPHRYPAGIHHVLVNGKLVVEDGEHTGARPGQALRRS